MALDAASRMHAFLTLYLPELEGRTLLGQPVPVSGAATGAAALIFVLRLNAR